MALRQIQAYTIDKNDNLNVVRLCAMYKVGCAGPGTGRKTSISMFSKRCNREIEYCDEHDCLFIYTSQEPFRAFFLCPWPSPSFCGSAV